jgi:hypothetical protein
MKYAQHRSLNEDESNPGQYERRAKRNECLAARWIFHNLHAACAV